MMQSHFDPLVACITFEKGCPTRDTIPIRSLFVCIQYSWNTSTVHPTIRYYGAPRSRDTCLVAGEVSTPILNLSLEYVYLGKLCAITASN